jgi:protein-S-isoprenylcysteine O-methyltransferase Ste14
MFGSIFEIIYLIGFIVGSMIRGTYSRQLKRAIIETDYETILDKILMIISSLGLVIFPLIFVLTPWLDFANYKLPVLSGWIGAAVFNLALILLWRSHADLGVNWSPKLVIMDGQSLVTKGIYKYIRHPMYAAHWLWGIAQPLLLHNWIAGLTLMLSFIPLYFQRVSKEEKMLLEEFGDEYIQYMKSTGRIIPRILR